MKWFTRIFGDESSRILKDITPLVARVNAYEEVMNALDATGVAQKTAEFKDRLAKGETVDDLLPEAFALTRRAAFLTLGMRHYDVQIIGGAVLHRGLVAEMRTGEGKTLMATLPVYLNALEGKGVHVVTVNDYLARRDAQWMGQIYAALGLTVGVINDRQSYIYDTGHQEVDANRDQEGSFKVFYEFLRPCSRKEAYAADITYGTNSQFGFDYLRDNTERRIENIVQRGHHFVIVDEVDSILIDEARVPLILSTQAQNAEGLYNVFAQVAAQLHPGEKDEETKTSTGDYTVDEKFRAVELTDAGIEKAQKLLKIDNIYTAEHIKLVHHLETAVRAKALYARDRDYVVANGQVVIVDPFTGRMQEGRRWSDGLHQAVEAKEGVSIKEESKTSASITYQNYFKFYKKLSGMTGTALSSEEEFRKVYGFDVVVVPTHKAIARIDEVDLIYQTEEGKFKAIARKVKELQDKGQPVLIGTVSVEKNELLSAYLTQEGIKHTVLNAKNHEHEGEIIAQAGIKGSVTVATNMAGRGVDIKLGGNPTTKEKEEEIKQLGGLFVIGTERHEARRIDDQLRGRSGRQGDPGTTQFFVSLEDPLMKVFGSDKIKGMIGALGMPADMPIQNSFISRQLEKAQEKIEGFHFDARKHVLEYDDILSYHRNLIYERRRKILFSDDAYIAEMYEKVVSENPELETAIAEKRTQLGEEMFTTLLKELSLYIIDRLWMEHLEVMSDTRQSVNLRAYGQREPLVEYKRESSRLFHELEYIFAHELGDMLSRLDVDAIINAPVRTEPAEPNAIEEAQANSDTVIIVKGGEVREVKRKKLQQWLDTGWEVRG